MNIFYLDSDPSICARYHCDKHVVKMVLESAQLLSTAHRVLDHESCNPLCYKAAHVNHPSSVWVRQSHMHYEYLFALFVALCQEYTKRYGKQHACTKLIEVLEELPRNIPSKCFLEPPQCMPSYCKHRDTVTAYRQYYMNEKEYMAKWSKGTPTPSWYKPVPYGPTL